MIAALRTHAYRLVRRSARALEPWKYRLLNRWRWAFGYREYLDHQLRRSAWTRDQAPSRHGLEVAFEALRPALGNGDRLLDLGCGDGFFLDLASKVTDRAVGLDRHLGKLARARRHGRLATSGDLHRLPFGDAAFQAIHCSHVLEHALRVDLMVREMARVLVPGGVLLVVVPSTGGRSIKHPHAFASEDDLRAVLTPDFDIDRLWPAATREPEWWALARRTAS